MPKPNTPLVGIVMGSVSDREKMQGAVEVLDKLGIPNESVVLSAHRTPDECAEYAKTAAERGIRVLIGGAGWSRACPACWRLIRYCPWSAYRCPALPWAVRTRCTP